MGLLPSLPSRHHGGAQHNYEFVTHTPSANRTADFPADRSFSVSRGRPEKQVSVKSAGNCSQKPHGVSADIAPEIGINSMMRCAARAAA